MKFRFLIAAMFAAGLFVWSSCKDSDVLDVTENFTYENEMSIYTTGTEYTSTDTVDMVNESSTIAQYGDKIKDIQIQEVQYWLTAFNGDPDQQITEASLKIAATDGSGVQTIATLQNVTLANLLNNPTQLPVSQDGIDRMADLIRQSPHAFVLTYHTASNTAPLDFTVKFSFKIKMTANPLN